MRCFRQERCSSSAFWNCLTSRQVSFGRKTGSQTRMPAPLVPYLDVDLYSRWTLDDGVVHRISAKQPVTARERVGGRTECPQIEIVFDGPGVGTAVPHQ